MTTHKPVQQVYTDYTATDFAVWQLLFDRQMKLLQPLASAQYLDAVHSVGFTASSIPDFQVLNRVLQHLSGWSITVVPNLCPEKEFFEHLSRRQFTATCWLRSLDQLDYIEEPDMFHDVFAHVPLLSNKDYVQFLKGLSDIALSFIDRPEIIQLLGRLYWFTIEYGLIRENNTLKIYGAGIISSAEETVHCLGAAARHRPFDIASILQTAYQTDRLQEQYFVIESFEQLYASLPGIEKQLQRIDPAPAGKLNMLLS